jgi:hypothetical protein
MASHSENMAFALSEGDLKAALDLLRGRTPKDTYRELWILLTVEQERRRLRATPAEIRLGREAFDALPSDVQALLRPLLSEGR